MTLLRRAVITNVTIKWLFPLMNWWNMLVKVTFTCTVVITNFTRNWLLLFMNRCNVSVQNFPFRTFIAAYIACKWILFFIYGFFKFPPFLSVELQVSLLLYFFWLKSSIFQLCLHLCISNVHANNLVFRKWISVSSGICFETCHQIFWKVI